MARARSALRTEIESARQAFSWNEAALRRLFLSKDGPVVRDLARRAARVEVRAKQNASHPPPSEPGTGPAVRTGRLRGSITWRLGVDALGPYADIGSAVHYAPYVELGTKSMQARPFLRPALSAARLG